MNEQEVMAQEYNNLWNEKLVHKQSIRKFHNYLSYITAIGSLTLAFHGISAQDFFKFGSEQATTNHIFQNAGSIVSLFFIVFTPVVIITLTFPLTDIFHIYVMGRQIGELEKKINAQFKNRRLLTWEHIICPIVYGGEKVNIGEDIVKISNVISLGDILLLIPAITVLCTFSTVISSIYISEKLGCWATVGYLLIIIYMVVVIITLGLTVKKYTKVNGPLFRAVRSQIESAKELDDSLEGKLDG